MHGGIQVEQGIWNCKHYQLEVQLKVCTNWGRDGFASLKGIWVG